MGRRGRSLDGQVLAMDKRKALQTFTPARTAVLATVLALVVVWLTKPYDVGKPSTILLSEEVYERILGVAKTGDWPKDQTDPRYRPGPRSIAEAKPPTFRLVQVEPTTQKGRSALYRLTIRGQERTVRARVAALASAAADP